MIQSGNQGNISLYIMLFIIKLTALSASSFLMINIQYVYIYIRYFKGKKILIQT
jgi:hypothetical protein